MNTINKRPIKLRKLQHKLCPSGAIDNGLYFLSENRVCIPRGLMHNAILEGVELRTVEGVTRALKLTINGSSWLVEDNGALLKEFT